MSDRPGLIFGADITEGPVKQKLRELEAQVRQANQDLSDLEVKTLAATQMVTEMGHDALFMIEQVGQMAGVQWTATQKLTLTMIEQAFLAANKALEMISIGAPMMVPWVLAAYGSLMGLANFIAVYVR
jgi:hypothetical protein